MSLDELIEERASAAAGPSHAKTLIRLYQVNKATAPSARVTFPRFLRIGSPVPRDPHLTSLKYDTMNLAMDSSAQDEFESATENAARAR